MSEKRMQCSIADSDYSAANPKKKKSVKVKYERKLSFKMLQDERFSTWIERSKNNPNIAFCKFCDREIRGNVNQLKRHKNTEKHIKNVNNPYKKKEMKKKAKLRWSVTNMRQALNAVLSKKMGYMSASLVFHVPKTTLMRYSRKYKTANQTEPLTQDRADKSEVTTRPKPVSETLSSADSFFQHIFPTEPTDMELQIKKETQFEDKLLEEKQQMAFIESTLLATQSIPARSEMQVQQCSQVAVPPSAPVQPAPSQAPSRQMAAAQSTQVTTPPSVQPAPSQAPLKQIAAAQSINKAGSTQLPDSVPPVPSQTTSRQMAAAQSTLVAALPPAPVQPAQSQMASAQASVQPVPNLASSWQIALTQSAEVAALPSVSVKPTPQQEPPRQMAATQSTQVATSQVQVQKHLQVAASLPARTQPAPRQVQLLTLPVQRSVAKPKPVGKPRTRKKRLLVVSNHHQSVMSSLASLWKSGKLCDAGIGNGSSTVKVHKVILSAVCPKLLSVFSADFFSHKFLQVNFPAEVSKEALKAFAEYMYRGVLNLDHDILEQLKIIAKKLDMKEFEELCDSHLHKLQPASTTDVPLIETTIPIPVTTSSLASAISPSINSTLSTNTPVIDIKQEISKDELAQVVFSQESEEASLDQNKSGNAVDSVISPSIKTEWVGPEDSKYGHCYGSSTDQASTSTTSSSSSSSIAAAPATVSISITSVTVSSSTEFAIPFSKGADDKSTRLKATHSHEAPLVSDSYTVSSIVETVCSQSNHMNADYSEPLSRSPVLTFPIDGPSTSTNNEGVYPVRLFTARGDSLPLLTTQTVDAKPIDLYKIDLT